MKISKYIFCIIIISYSFQIIKSQDNATDTLKTFLLKKINNNSNKIEESDFISLLSILEKENNDSLQAIICNKAGIYYYNKVDSLCVKYFKKAADSYFICGNLGKTALCFQNIAFNYDERQSDYKKAINYSMQALQCWNELDDTLNIANMYKYLGSLKGKLSIYNEAKTDIMYAISLYNLTGFEKGKAVSLYNLAMVYKDEGRIDSCMFFFNKSKKIWNTYNELSRVFLINNQFIEIYLQKLDFSKVDYYFYENSEIIKSEIFIYWRSKYEFYILVSRMYQKKDNLKLSKEYRQKAENLKRQY